MYKSISYRFLAKVTLFLLLTTNIAYAKDTIFRKSTKIDVSTLHLKKTLQNIDKNIEHKKYFEALSEINKSIHDDSLSTSLLSNLFYKRAKIYTKMGRYDDAVRNYTKILWLTKSKKHIKVDILAKRAYLLIKNRKIKEAKTDLEEAAHLDPKNATVQYLIAQIFSIEGKHKKAIQRYKKANTHGYRDKTAIKIALAKNLYALGERNNALNLIRAVIKQYPYNSKAIQLLQIIDNQKQHNYPKKKHIKIASNISHLLEKPELLLPIDKALQYPQQKNKIPLYHTNEKIVSQWEIQSDNALTTSSISNSWQTQFHSHKNHQPKKNEKTKKSLYFKELSKKVDFEYEDKLIAKEAHAMLQEESNASKNNQRLHNQHASSHKNSFQLLRKGHDIRKRSHTEDKHKKLIPSYYKKQSETKNIQNYKVSYHKVPQWTSPQTNPSINETQQNSWLNNTYVTVDRKHSNGLSHSNDETINTFSDHYQQDNNNMKNDFRIQLGVFRSQKNALKMWDNLYKKNTNLFQNKKPLIIVKNNKHLGLRYYLQVSGYNNENETRYTCHLLRQNTFDCIKV